MRENTPRTPLVTRAFTGADDRESRRMTLSLASSPAIEIAAAFFTKFLSTTEQCACRWRGIGGRRICAGGTSTS